MAGIPAARVVAVIAKLDTGKTQIGSGYLLDAMRVLTAWHCTFDRKTERPAIALSVVGASGGVTGTVTVSEASPTLDVAVLAFSHDSRWAGELPGGPVAFGKMDRDHTGELNGCEAAGYPLWQGSETGNYRDIAELHGPIRALEGMEDQRLVFRDPALKGVGPARTGIRIGIGIAGVASVAADHQSPWDGLSGAAVFHGGLLLGVIIEHHPRQGDTALQIRPIEAIALASDIATARLAEALGILAPDAIRHVEPLSSDADGGPSGSKQNIRADRDAYTAARDLSVYSDKSTTVNVNFGELKLPLGSRPDALAIICAWCAHTLREVPPYDTVEQLITHIERLLPRPGEVPPIQQVTELAEQEPPMRSVEGPPGEVPTGAASEHCLAVILQQNLFNADLYRMSVVQYRDGSNAVPLWPQMECDDRFAPLEEVREKVRTLLPELSRKLGLGTVLVEFTVPENLLGSDFDQWPLASYPGAPIEFDFRLGEKYPVVVRDQDRMKSDLELWESRWRRLLGCDGPAHEAVHWETPEATTRFKPFRARLRNPETAGHVILALWPARVSARIVDDMIRAGIAAGMPAAIWIRRQHAARASIEDDLDYLKKMMVQGDLRSLPHRVQTLRSKAVEEDGKAAHPGRRLSLLWADPGRSWDPQPFAQPALSANGDDL